MFGRFYQPKVKDSVASRIHLSTMRYFKVFTKRSYTDSEGNERELISRVGHEKIWPSGIAALRIFLLPVEFYLFEIDSPEENEQRLEVCLQTASVRNGAKEDEFERIGEVRFSEFGKQQLIFDKVPSEMQWLKKFDLHLEERIDESEENKINIATRI